MAGEEQHALAAAGDAFDEIVDGRVDLAAVGIDQQGGLETDAFQLGADRAGVVAGLFQLVDGAVVIDADDQGVTRAGIVHTQDAGVLRVGRGQPEQGHHADQEAAPGDVGARRPTRADSHHRDHSGPMTSPAKPKTRRSPARATSRTLRVWPGSKRTAVPAAMSRR